MRVRECIILTDEEKFTQLLKVSIKNIFQKSNFSQMCKNIKFDQKFGSL